jgi:hypothetical protein
MDNEGYEYGSMRSITIIDSGLHIPFQVAMDMHLSSTEDNFYRYWYIYLYLYYT